VRSSNAPFPSVIGASLVKAQMRWRQCETYLPTQCPEAGETARLSPSHVDAPGPDDHQEPSPARPGAAVSLIERVTDHGSFVALRHPAKRVRRGALRIAYLPDAAGRRRCAYALSRRVGNAVVRNRIRRRLRSVFVALDREASAGATPFPSGTYLVSATAAAADLPYATLLDTARALLIELDHHGASR
jgi:RNase P protein component